MSDPRMTMMDPPIESLMEKVGSKFGLVSLAASRGREINTYFNQLGEGLGSIVPPQVTSLARKPLSIAFEEIAIDKIVPVWGGKSIDRGGGPADLLGGSSSRSGEDGLEALGDTQESVVDQGDSTDIASQGDQGLESTGDEAS